MTELSEIVETLKEIKTSLSTISEFMLQIAYMNPGMDEYLEHRPAAQQQEKAGCEGSCEGCGDST